MAGLKGRTNKPIDKEARNNIITMRFSDEELEQINKIAKELNMPKTRLIRNLTLAGLEDANILNKLGVLKGVKKLIDFKKRYLHPEKYKTLPAENLKAI